MWNRQAHNAKAMKRNAERVERETDVPRLLSQTPDLRSLYIEISESNRQDSMPSVPYIKRFVLESALALFWVPCGDPRCDGGGHDITHEVLAGLKSKQLRIEGEDFCNGDVGTGMCSRKVKFAAIATYA
jgi:hypothetical protein